jgi:hypothetical protein
MTHKLTRCMQRDEFGNTALMCACQNGHKRIVKLCFKYGADLSQQNYQVNLHAHCGEHIPTLECARTNECKYAKMFEYQNVGSTSALSVPFKTKTWISVIPPQDFKVYANKQYPPPLGKRNAQSGA